MLRISARCSATFKSGLLMVHLMLTLVMGVWAWVLISPQPTFVASPIFAWFASHWPRTERGWSGMFFIAFLCGLAGLVARNRWARLASVVLLGGAHGTVAYVMWVADEAAGYDTPAPYIYTLFAVAAVWRVAAEEWL